MSMFVNVKEEKIHVVHNQGTNGKSLLFLHPALAQGVFFMPLVAQLNGAGFTTVVIDAPNHNLSTGTSRKTIEEYADFTEDLVEVLQSESLVGEKVSLVGWSMGGTISYELATRKPAWLEYVVMLSSSNYWGFNPLPFTEEEYNAGHCPRPPQNGEETYIRAFLNTAKPMLPPFSSCLGDWNACASYDGRNKASQITVPLLHLWGDKDELGAHEGNLGIQKDVPTAISDFHEGATHNLPGDKPAEVYAVIAEFVTYGVQYA